MWKTGWAGMRFSFVAYLVPFIWIYDPALLMIGSVTAIVIVAASTTAAIMLVTRSMSIRLDGALNWIRYLSYWLAAIGVALSPIFFGAESLIAGCLAIAAMAWWATCSFLSVRTEREC
ncbi:hypothetical protein [Aquamicrobium sp. LC103]|uniref:hypothetical protein n=1 Tax=Aquamicrobium sp. LC103 TaxID=1120658 RepID=UPI00063EA238|nr:hypothetical protein [Aquamicrobium sp. LC103]TKT69884.1 hypothetical protein XW59_025775 [Aquamicrobium sp. LC103]